MKEPFSHLKFLKGYHNLFPSQTCYYDKIYYEKYSHFSLIFIWYYNIERMYLQQKILTIGG